MAQLFVPLTGAFGKVAGSGYNTYGENLDRPQWRGAELGSLTAFPDVWGAVAEAEFHDWIIGVHHPSFIEGGPAWCRFLDQDATVRQEALAQASSAAQAARQLGARYILFHFPWPAVIPPGLDAKAHGWYYTYSPQGTAADWTEGTMYAVSRRAFDHFAAIAAREEIKIVLEIDGPNPYFIDGELYSRLFTEFPELTLCVDTGRLGLLARTHGQDPVALAKRWLPWTRHLHLHTSRWDEAGRFQNHIPTNATHTAAGWPSVTPAADIARMVVDAQPQCTIVLEHNPKSVSPEALEEAHAWALDLVGLST